MHDYNNDPLTGTTAMVTGAASGIGRACTIALAARGASVAGVDTNEAGLRMLAESLDVAASARFLPIKASVCNAAEIAQAAEHAIEAFGCIQTLVAAAGILRASAGPKLAMHTSPEEWDAVIDTNLKGTFLTNRAVLPGMIAARRGQIINIASIAGKMGTAYDAAYCASKAGIIGFSESLAEEVRSYDVRVFTVLPGAVDTPLWKQNGPIPRPAEALDPSRIADLIIYLLRLPPDTILINPQIVPFRTRPPRHQKTRRQDDTTIAPGDER
jgi:NAD(P)-dependent dehydrogenase (short-subunit alcohol dehydrogenase family)